MENEALLRFSRGRSTTGRWLRPSTLFYWLGAIAYLFLDFDMHRLPLLHGLVVVLDAITVISDT